MPGPSHAERRLHPRVRVSTPLALRPMTRSAALVLGEGVLGDLVDASRGGVAFSTPSPLVPGDLVEIEVRSADGDVVLIGPYGRVLHVAEGSKGRFVVRCAFASETADEGWLEQIAARRSDAG